MTLGWNTPLVPKAARALAPTLLLGAAVSLGMMLISLIVTGTFVFEGASSPGEAEHVSPYFGAVIGAILTTGAIGAWQLAALWRRRLEARN